MTTDITTISLVQHQDYQFDNQFGAGVPVLRSDEPPPLGQGAGPSPVQMLGAAVGNCLGASLLFALRKFRQKPEPIRCEVDIEVGRNDASRLRVLGIAVRLHLGTPAGALEHLDRVLASFEDFCTVTASLRGAFPVAVQVFDATGRRLTA